MPKKDIYRTVDNGLEINSSDSIFQIKSMDISNHKNNNKNLPKNTLKTKEDTSLYTNFLKTNLPSKFNINRVYLDYDDEDNQKICIFQVGNKSAKEISDLGLKIREEAYNYAKDNNLLNCYNKFVFLVRR